MQKNLINKRKVKPFIALLPKLFSINKNNLTLK